MEKNVDIDVSYDEYLVDTLRRIGNLSVKRGCDTGCCGLCSIWIDEKPTLSCSTLSVRANKKNITTIEGFTKEASEFAQILVNEGAEQCGFCSPGFIMTVLAMKKGIRKSNRRRNNTLLNWKSMQMYRLYGNNLEQLKHTWG